MTSAARTYGLLAAVVVFFLAWAVVAAHPWRRAAAVDPRIAALDTRRAALRWEARRVQRVVDRRWAAYRVALARRRRLIAAATARALAQQQQTITQFVAAPTVVSAPPATATHSS